MWTRILADRHWCSRPQRLILNRIQAAQGDEMWVQNIAEAASAYEISR